jgi:hypothetical protein
MKKLLLLVAGIALVTVACRAEVNVSVDIEEDRSGTIAFEFGIDEEFRELIESSGGTTEDLFGDLDLGIDLGVEGGAVIERTDGDMTYTGAKQEFADISEVMSDLIGETNDDALFQEFSFVMDDESAALSATATGDATEAGDLPFDPTELTDDVFSANFILGMPGTVVEHNADEVLSDGRLLWALPILGGTQTFIAKSEFGGSSLWWLWIILGVVLVVGVIAIIAAVLLGKKQEKQAVTDAAAAYPQPAVDALDVPPVGAAAASSVSSDDKATTPPATVPDVSDTPPADEPAVPTADSGDEQPASGDAARSEDSSGGDEPTAADEDDASGV